MAALWPQGPAEVANYRQRRTRTRKLDVVAKRKKVWWREGWKKMREREREVGFWRKVGGGERSCLLSGSRLFPIRGLPLFFLFFYISLSPAKVRDRFLAAGSNLCVWCRSDLGEDWETWGQKRERITEIYINAPPPSTFLFQIIFHRFWIITLDLNILLTDLETYRHNEENKPHLLFSLENFKQ